MKQLSPDFFTLTGEQDFHCRSTRLTYDKKQQSIRLTRNDNLRLPSCSKQQAELLLENHTAALCDADLQLAWISSDGKSLLTGSVINDESGEPVRVSAADDSANSAEMLELHPVETTGDAVFTDLAMWQRYIALCWSDEAADRHGVDIIELGTKRHYLLDTLEFSPANIWIDRQQRVWVVDSHNQLLLCTGQPLPQQWNPAATIFRPLHDNPHPFSIQKTIQLPEGEPVLSLCSDDEFLYLLREGELLQIRLDNPAQAARIFTLDSEIPYVTDCRSVEADRIALWVPAELDQLRAAQDCPLVELDAETDIARLVLERYPRRRLAHNAFLANPDASARYLSVDHVLELTGLPQVRYHRSGISILQKKLDSRLTDTLWDRISIDACIPAGSKIFVQLRAYDDKSERTQRDWHDQGQAVLSTLSSRAATSNARVWELVIRKQKNSGQVREIRGRYLEIKLHLESNGLSTPQIFSMQFWYPRISWQQQYLPEFMHQVEQPVEDSTELANGADVRERMLTALAAMSYTVEQRIDTAETLIDPLTAPETLLQQLELMVGEHPPAHWPIQRRRHWLAQSGAIQRWRGTFKGLCLALDIATDGAVTRGQVVPVEDYRLRRPLFSALGVDFSSAFHPLTLDSVQSGNSIVGDTLILGPDDARTLLLDLLPDASESSTVNELLEAYADSYSYRLSLILHGSAADYRALIEELFAAELPVHLEANIIESNRSFVPGLAPLLGIHSYLQEFPEWQRLILNRDKIGGSSVLMNRPVLKPGRAAETLFNGENT
jgi:phage tail-like protein